MIKFWLYKHSSIKYSFNYLTSFKRDYTSIRIALSLSFIIRVGGIGITVFILFTRYLYGKEVSIVQNFFNFCVNRSELSSRFLWWFLWFLFFLRLLCFFHWFRRLLWWFCRFCWFCWRLWWFFGCCRFRFLWCLLSFIWCRDWFPVLEKIIRI